MWCELQRLWMVVIYDDYKSLLQMLGHCELHILFITLKALQTFMSISQTLLTKSTKYPQQSKLKSWKCSGLHLFINNDK